MSVSLPVSANDVLELLINEGKALFVCEDANDGELCDEPQVSAQLAHVGGLVLLPCLKVLLPCL